MNTAYITVTAITAIITAGIALAGFARASFVAGNMDEVGAPRSWMPKLATLKLAGAIGLIGGLVGFRPLGIAAALGLVLFFIGAVTAHLRAHVLYNIAFPGAYLALSTASLALAIIQ
ncbi:MAG: DoxX family protein [Acidimicrobiia bacterium]|nr:DoxX family protein [Acidimicrobiia bacterium]